MKRTIFLLPLLMLLVSCAPTPQATQAHELVSTTSPDTAVTNLPDATHPVREPMENPFAPQPKDSELTRQKAFVQKASLMVRESYPPQISLNLSGDLPTPCNLLRVEIGLPTADNKINIDVYSVIDPNKMCTQMVKPFEESIDLGTFPSGHYSVLVNGEPAGEFDS